MRKKIINNQKFAPDKMYFIKEEETFRHQFCLNGKWQFQPVQVPSDYIRNTGTPPELSMPDSVKYSDVPIHIPSPWNGNIWGPGRIDRLNAENKYTPDSIYYPSYPAEWEHIEMGWLRRSFKKFDNLSDDMRIILHFEAIAGYADVYVNGKYAGNHFDQYLPFEFDITDLLNDGDNELLVGVKHQRFFDKQSKKYKNMRTTYAHGSNTQDLAGIWQDVWLFAVPAARIEDVYIKPLLDIDMLELDITIRNDTDYPQTLTIGGTIHPTFASCEAIPENKLLDNVMGITPRTIMISAHSSVTVTCKEKNNGRLLMWSDKTPNLYTALLNLQSNDKICDVRAERFGWRQFTIEGRNILLNGEEIHLVGDICHPFGPYMFSRRFIISWYNLIRKVGGNAVRLHAQIYPKIFLDVADEMGIMVLDETGIFGSCLSLNFEDEIAWERYNAHYDGLIKRDRNRPSVFGWSFGNELFAIFIYDEVAKRDENIFYAKLFELGNRTRLWDTTRPFITCDGDEDLCGTLDIWSKHYGHGTPPDLSHITKPVVVGENGGTYYAKPEQLAIFNGERAYESYEGRAEALGIDLYDNIRAFGKTLAYFSPSELVWFGLEHLPYGYSDFSRLPDLDDGVFFTNREEGQPGMYIERIPPYVGTLNPGYDDNLPEYKPLAMFEAMRDALKFDDSLNDKWKRKITLLPEPVKNNNISYVKYYIINSDETVKKVGELLNLNLTLTENDATMLYSNESHPFVDNLSLADMYTAENKEQKYIIYGGIEGLPVSAKILLKASATDWSLFNNRPENAKCGAVFMREAIEKHNTKSKAAFALIECGEEIVALTTIRKEHISLIRKLLSNMGFELDDMSEIKQSDIIEEHNLLLNGPVNEL